MGLLDRELKVSDYLVEEGGEEGIGADLWSRSWNQWTAPP